MRCAARSARSKPVGFVAALMHSFRQAGSIRSGLTFRRAPGCHEGSVVRSAPFQFPGVRGYAQPHGRPREARIAIAGMNGDARMVDPAVAVSHPGKRILFDRDTNCLLRCQDGALIQESIGGYSIFGIGVDRKHVLKWLFSKEKATLHAPQKVYVYSENAPEEGSGLP
jgi:hypothetical protein